MSESTEDRVKFLRGLRAVREYTPEPVSEAAIADILEIGRWSGSASNRQPAEVVLVTDKQILQLLTENGVRAAAGAPLALISVMPGDPERRELEIFDDGRMVERLLLAARAHGLGSNVSTLKGEGPNLVKAALGIPAERRLWTVVTIGHIDREARKARPPRTDSARKPIGEFAHRERY